MCRYLQRFDFWIPYLRDKIIQVLVKEVEIYCPIVLDFITLSCQQDCISSGGSKAKSVSLPSLVPRSYLHSVALWLLPELKSSGIASFKLSLTSTSIVTSPPLILTLLLSSYEDPYDYVWGPHDSFRVISTFQDP